MKLKYNKYIIFLLIIIFFDLKCFYLSDNQSVSDNITLILEVLFMSYVFLTYRNTQTYYKYKWFMLFSIILVITSSFAAFYSYNQPIFLGIRAQRHWLVPMLMYFPITKLLQSDKIKMHDLISALDMIVIIYSVIIIAQYIIGDSYLFLNIQTGTRNGTIRLYADLSFVRIVYFFHLASFFGEKKKGSGLIKDLLFIGIELFLEVFVCQSRISILAVIATSALMFLWQKNYPRKIAMFVIVITAICVFMCTSFGSSFANSIMDGLQGEGSEATIRVKGRDFYMDELLDDPITIIFGCGYANIDWEQTVTAIRRNENIFWVDNGIYGLAFYYGFLFVIWMLITHYILMRDAWKTSKSWLFFYLFCGLIGIYTSFPYCYVTNISFSLVCAMIERNMPRRYTDKEENRIVSIKDACLNIDAYKHFKKIHK